MRATVSREWGEAMLWDLAELVPLLLANAGGLLKNRGSHGVPLAAFSVLAQHVSTPFIPQVLALLLQMSAKDESLPILGRLVDRIVQQDRESQCDAWRMITQRMSEHDRPHALQLLKTTMPLLAAVGGPNAIVAASLEVQRAGRQWR